LMNPLDAVGKLHAVENRVRPCSPLMWEIKRRMVI
jgi:hypothetical protein